MGGRGVIIQATMSSLFLLQSYSGSASTGVLKLPASVAHRAEQSSQADPKQALFGPMPASGPLPQQIPISTQLFFLCVSFFLSLPSASPMPRPPRLPFLPFPLFCSHSFPPSSPQSPSHSSHSPPSLSPTPQAAIPGQ